MQMSFYIKERNLYYLEELVKIHNGRMLNNPLNDINFCCGGIFVSINFSDVNDANEFNKKINIVKQPYF